MLGCGVFGGYLEVSAIFASGLWLASISFSDLRSLPDRVRRLEPCGSVGGCTR